MARRLSAELIGTAVLVAAVVGSGIMATALTDNVGIELLINALATCAALGVLIVALGPISGAHFNPAVTLVAAVQREIRVGEAVGYLSFQVVGALVGVAVANVMFELPTWSLSTHERTGSGLWLGEVVATAGLLFAIGALTRLHRASLGPVVIPAWIGAAYFFTASTSFANPAVTLGRAFSDTFSGIALSSVPAFVIFQLVGAAIGAIAVTLLYARDPVEPFDLPEAVHDPA